MKFYWDGHPHLFVNLRLQGQSWVVILTESLCSTKPIWIFIERCWPLPGQNIRWIPWMPQALSPARVYEALSKPSSYSLSLHTWHLCSLELSVISKMPYILSLKVPCLFLFLWIPSYPLRPVFSLLTAQSLSHVWLFATPWTVACQAPLTIGFSRQNTGVGWHSLLLGFFLTQGSKLSLLHCRKILYHLSYQGYLK